MDKLDLTKKYKTYYSAKSTPEIVEIEAARFLSIQGQGDPSGTNFQAHLQALYSTAYTLKFSCKALQLDFAVPKLEALWWFDAQKYGGCSMTEAPQKIPRAEWCYKLLIRMPDFVPVDLIEQSKSTVSNKKGIALADQVTLEHLHEGKCVQILHIGPYTTEPVSLQKMMEVMSTHHFKQNGPHHEIYLSDYNKTDPQKLKTILREPVIF